VAENSEDDVSEIFLELANETRCDILLLLMNNPHRPTEISKKLDITIQETHRNTSRMTEADLISKDSNGFFNLTDYGKIISEQISYFIFFNLNKKFFKNHTVGKIPSKNRVFKKF